MVSDQCAGRRTVLALFVALLGAVAASAQDSETADSTPPAAIVDQITGGPFQVSVIFTNLAGDPSSAVPGLPGASFQPGTGTTQFDRVFGSPSGLWILTADTDRPAGTDEVLVVDSMLGAVEGDPASWTGGTEAIGSLETRCGVNDSGDWVFATNTDGPTGADEYIVRSTAGVLAAVAHEGQPVAAIPGATWGSTLESAQIAADGTVGLVSDSLGGVPTAENEAFLFGSGLLAREGESPLGQVGTEVWENFDVNDAWVSADGARWIAQGDLTGATATDDVVVVDREVVVQEGVVVAGSGFVSPVDSVQGVHMSASGVWMVRGDNDDGLDWVLVDGAVVAQTGTPFIGGAVERWDDTDFSDCYFLHVANSAGDFVVGGVTDAASDVNGVLALNGTTEIVRESDPIDLDGDGLFDDDAFFDTFGNDDAHLTDAGLLYLVATIKDGSGTRTGQGFFSIDLTGVIPVELQSFTID
ncbi:MAG: hypothetical protein AAGC60_14575 [Acidobacteriota bacterium]